MDNGYVLTILAIYIYIYKNIFIYIYKFFFFYWWYFDYFTVLTKIYTYILKYSTGNLSNLRTYIFHSKKQFCNWFDCFQKEMGFFRHYFDFILVVEHISFCLNFILVILHIYIGGVFLFYFHIWLNSHIATRQLQHLDTVAWNWPLKTNAWMGTKRSV